MDATTASTLTEVLIDIFLGSFSVLIVCWSVAGIQTFILDHKRDKRDLEYHKLRMKKLNQ